MPSRIRARGSRKIYINFTPSVERRSMAYPSVVGDVRRNSIACVRASSRDRVCTSTYTSLSYDLFDTYISTYIQSHANIRARARVPLGCRAAVRVSTSPCDRVTLARRRSRRRPHTPARIVDTLVSSTLVTSQSRQRARTTASSSQFPRSRSFERVRARSNRYT